VISFAKHNLCKTLIVKVCIHSLSIKLFLDAFFHNNHTNALSIALVHHKQYITHVYCVFSNHVVVVVVV
jgi:hypothetical protein